MSHKSIEKVAVVIPNFNGEKMIAKTIDSLLVQTLQAAIIVVENASTDNSLGILRSYRDKITVIENSKNLGFAGGVNTGIRHAIEKEYDAIALLNNDAVVDKAWLSKLTETMTANSSCGIVTGKIKLSRGDSLDSTGEFYTTWGLPFPRGRGKSTELYSNPEEVFGASGGASLYRTATLQDIGLFDESFFAYYEDTDISFRAQLAGWKIFYNPEAITIHEQGATSKKMVKGFTVYQTFKNLPMLFWKNVPLQLIPPIGLRFAVAYTLILGKAVAGGKVIPALKGCLVSVLLSPMTIYKRFIIQKNRSVSAEYIKSIIVSDLPPDQTGLRKLRTFITRK